MRKKFIPKIRYRSVPKIRYDIVPKIRYGIVPKIRYGIIPKIRYGIVPKNRYRSDKNLICILSPKVFQYEEMNKNQRRYMGGGWALGPHMRFEILSTW